MHVVAAYSQGDGGRKRRRKPTSDEGTVRSGRGPGLVAKAGTDVIGWIQIDRRAAFPRLASSRVLKPMDELDVWSVSCFFIDKRFRRTGLSLKLLNAAVDWAHSRGAAIVEGYPIDTPRQKFPSFYAWTGFLGTFRQAGFAEVARRSDTRPIMRKALGDDRED